jgi:hypothetical protein
MVLEANGCLGTDSPPGPGPQVTAAETREKIKQQCSSQGVNTNQDADAVFQGNVRAALNRVYSRLSASPNHSEFQFNPSIRVPNSNPNGAPRPLDGFVMSGTLMSAILEVKNSPNINNYDAQVKDHIRHLASFYRPAADFGPTYFLVSQAGSHHPFLAQWAAFANARGVSFVHFNLRERTFGGGLYLDGGYIGNTVGGSGVIAPWWLNWLRHGSAEFSFIVDCSKSET